MTGMTRRDFTRLASVSGAALSQVWSSFAIAQSAAKVVIIGGGAGGATVAHYLKKAAAQIDVTLIEINPIYSSSFFSNLYIGGLRALESLNHSYAGLQRLGIKVVHDLATDVDGVKKTVKTKGGRTYRYDRLVLSPGIDMNYDTISGYTQDAARVMPHAYGTSAFGKRQLKQQLHALRDGGTVVLSPPSNPYSCPAGPYERACMIAHYLKVKKPKSKLIILDPKKAFSMQGVFTEAFDKYYKGIIELNLTSEIDDFSLLRVDARTKDIVTKAGRKIRADVANIIPQQRAGEIAHKAGVTDGDWSPVHPQSFASRTVRHIYVLGDAAVAAEMPKSAFAANSQAKAVVRDILADLANTERSPARYRNTCWSILAPDDDVKTGANFAPKDGKLEAFDAFASQQGEAAAVRGQNYEESVSWYVSITADMFAKAGAANQDKPQPAANAAKDG
jgi:sulfide dehydrogenase [flavocytochrome c] flavoprotein chain